MMVESVCVNCVILPVKVAIKGVLMDALHVRHNLIVCLIMVTAFVLTDIIY
jgi:hypothetical protein